MRRGLLLVLIIVACGAVYLVGNGRVALWDRDEPRYALASKWMLQQGDWVAPRVGWGEDPNRPRTAKPVLIYWLQAAAMVVFGVGAFAARLPSVVGVTGTLCVVGAVVWRFVGWRRAMWTVGVLGTSALVVVAGKMCVTDGVLLLWVTVGQVCLCGIYLGRGSRDCVGPRGAVGRSGDLERGEGEVRWWVAGLMWGAIALGGLTKGPVVLGVHLATLVVLLGLDVGRRWRQWGAWRAGMGWWRRTRPVMGLVIVAAVCGPWLWMVQARAPGFLEQAIGHDVIRRSTEALEGHKGPPGFYLVTIFGTLFPWSLLLPLTIGLAMRHRRVGVIRFAVAAVVGPWLMMEMVATKLVHYVLPIFPPLAFLVADALVRCFRGQYADLRNRLAVTGTGAWAWIVIGLGVAPWVGWYWFYDFPRAAAGVVTGLMVAWAIVTWQLMRRGRVEAAMGVIGGGMVVVMLVVWGWFIPSASFLKVGERVGRLLHEQGAIEPGEVVMLHRYREQSVAFYQGGTIREAERGDLLLVAPPERWPRWIVMEWADWKRLPEARRARLEQIGAFDGVNVAKGEVVHVMVMRKR